MQKRLIGLFCIVLGIPPALAESSTGAQSDQVFACQQKVKQLSDEARPLQSKLATLRTERRAVSSSGGEVAQMKLSNLDQEILQITKKLEGVNGQISSETKRCDDLAHKSSGAATPPAAAAPVPAPSPRSNKRPNR
jgi:chromosome segregation ATPase